MSTIAGGSANGTATALAAAWNASTEPEFAEMTATANTATVTLTGDTAGTPYTITSSVAGGTGTIGAVSVTTAATGPNHWDNALNWSDGAVPVSTDTVYIENSDVPIKYGLDQSAVTLTLFAIGASFTAEIGLPDVNADGVEYYEYRSQYLTIKATTAEIGRGEGTGSGRIKWDASTAQTALTVHGMGFGLETDLEALQWKGTHASNVVNVLAGSVAIAGYSGDTSAVATLRVGHQGSVDSDASVRCGAGTTLTTIRQTGGALDIRSNATTVTMDAGSLLVHDAAAVTTLTADAGSVIYRSIGTITTLTLGSNSSIDFSQDPRPRTITNTVQMYSASSLLDPNSTVTFSNGIKLNRCDLTEVTLDVGQNRTLTIS